jgi:hypothetical protein
MARRRNPRRNTRRNTRRNPRRNPYTKTDLNSAEVVVYFVAKNLAQYHSFDPLVLKTLRGALYDLDAAYDSRGGTRLFERQKPAYDEAHSAIENAINILEEEKREYDDDGEYDDDDYDDEDEYDDDY